MNLFLNLNVIISPNSFNNSEENVLFSQYILGWIIKQNFEKIWIIFNEEEKLEKN